LGDYVRDTEGGSVSLSARGRGGAVVTKGAQQKEKIKGHVNERKSSFHHLEETSSGNEGMIRK